MHRLRRAFHSARRRHQALTLSSVQGALSPPLSTKSLPAYFREDILPNHSSRPALVCRTESAFSHGGPRVGTSAQTSDSSCLRWDFGEFDKHVGALARGLIGIGVKKGDRVGVVMGNNSAYAILQWACASVGAILTTLNPAYRLHELKSTLELAGVSHLVVVPRLRSSHYLQTLSAAFPELRSCAPGSLQVESLPSLRNLIVVDNENESQDDIFRKEMRSVIDWREVLIWGEGGREAGAVRLVERTLDKDEVVCLQFTSGTTGAPKAVSLTHSNLLNNALSIGRCMRLTPADIICAYHAALHLSSVYDEIGNVPPLFHCFDKFLSSSRLILGNLAAWSHGSCVIYPDATFNPPAIVDTILEEKCTALHGVPTHFLGVLAEVDKRSAEGSRALDFGTLRTGIAAGSPIPIELMKNLIEKLNLRELTNAYGMTETSPVSFQTTPADSIIKRTETVGKVQPHVKAKLIDEDGTVVPIGTPGEICVAGYLLQKGYWNDEQRTEEVTWKDEDGTVWMRTGDKGIMDEEGYLRVVGRLKDIIIRGGENLFPVQIENALTSNPGILEAAAVSVPDEKYGEQAGVWIVPDPKSRLTAEEVREIVCENMNPQNAPAWVWFVGREGMPGELPKTASGKVMKHILRDWSRDLAEKNAGRV